MKNYKMALSLLGILFFIVSSSFLSKKTCIDEYSDLGGWVKLGTQTVSQDVDYDELNITEVTKNFSRLKFKVLKAPIYIRNIHIIYEDDTSESQLITHRFKKGEVSRVLDLIGYERIIKKIIFNYSRPNSGKVQADLLVLAKQ
jgi:hypothetical protein